MDDMEVPKEPKVRKAILRFLNARVSLPSWMLALSSAGLAYIAIFLILVGTGLGTFGAALLFDGLLWSGLLALGSTSAIVGMIWKSRTFWLRWGAFLAFAMLVFGGIAFVLAGQTVTTIIVVVPWLLFYAYIYLASFFRNETGI